MEGSPFKITNEAAEETLEKAPEPVKPQPVESIGKHENVKYKINIKLSIFFLHLIS